MIEAPSNPVARAGRAGRQIDWEAIEREYRAGQLSVREIARRLGVTEAAIRSRAKREDWPRDLSQQVRERVRSELVRSDVRSDVRSESAREAVRTAAARGVEVVRQHRTRAANAQRVVAGLLAELDATAACLPEIEAEIDSTSTGLAKINAKQAISVGNRAKAAQALAQAMSTLTNIERVAFSLDADPERDSRQGIVAVAVAGASLDALSPAQLDAVETAHAALRAVGVAGESK